MGDENPIRTLGDYSKPSHEGYKNTNELPVGNNVKLGLVSRTYYKKSLIVALTFGSKSKFFMTMSILSQEPLTNRTVNEPRDFAKHVKAITLPPDVLSTSDRHLIDLKNQVQCFMEAHIARIQPNQVNKVTTLCEICSGPHETQYYMEDFEQAFVEYTSSRTDEAGEGLASNFMASQDARLSKFKADFKQKQNEMTNKINTALKFITDRITGTLPKDTIKNSKLSTSSVLSTYSYPTVDPQCSTHVHGNFTYVIDFMIVKDISSIIDPRMSQVVLGRPFIEIANMTHDPPEGVVRFTNGIEEVAYKMPHKIEQYNSLSNLEKEHTKLVYLRNKEGQEKRSEICAEQNIRIL
nr:retrotransposon Orf1 [Tanacetum cinerariifolium]